MKKLNTHELSSVNNNIEGLRCETIYLQVAASREDWDRAEDYLGALRRRITHIENSFRKHLREAHACGAELPSHCCPYDCASPEHGDGCKHPNCSNEEVTNASNQHQT